MASVNITVVINSPPSTSVVFTAAQPSFTAPVPAGTVIGTLSVEPAGWSGAVSLSGNAALALNGLQVVAAVDLAAGSYNASANATP